MSFFKTVSFFFFLLRTSIRASISVRLAFLLEATLLVFNNFVFLVMWWIFFRQFQEVSGWTMRDMIALNAMGMGGYGLMQVCFGGVRELSRSISRCHWLYASRAFKRLLLDEAHYIAWLCLQLFCASLFGFLPRLKAL